MESLSKLSHDPLQHTTTLPSTLLSQQLHSIFLELLSFSAVILIASIEAFFILHQWKPIFHFLFLCSFTLFFILKLFLSKPPPVYLVDFSCFKPPSFCRIPFSSFLENASLFQFHDAESLSFMAKVLTTSGQSEETCVPPSFHYIPPKTHLRESIKEVHMVLFPIMEDLLSKTNLSPRDIDILIVNCSGFCHCPSLSSIIINKYSMRSDIKSYTLSGMGCSASALAIDMAQSLLNIHRNSYALVLSTEILSSGWYSGNDRTKLPLNCLFRTGSAAILLSNRKEAKKYSKYKLFRTLRTQRAFDDKAYLSAFREEDSEDYFRLAPGKSVGLLKVPFTIRATSYTKGPDGNVAAPRTRTTLSPHREPFITLDSASFFVPPAPPYQDFLRTPGKLGFRVKQPHGRVARAVLPC